MNKISIMQPPFLPWAGFFYLLKKSNKMIFLTDVKLEKNSRQTKNFILKNNQIISLIVPVLGSRNQIINNSIIDDNQYWRKKISKTLEQTYNNHPYGKKLNENILKIINDNNINYLKDLNIQIIKTISNMLNIKTNFYMDTDYNFEGYKSEKIKNICNFFNIKNYISPIGAKNYIEKENILKKNNIEVKYIIDKPKVNYNQFRNNNDFKNNLSIVDIIANLGPEKTCVFLEKKFKFEN